MHGHFLSELYAKVIVVDFIIDFTWQNSPSCRNITSLFGSSLFSTICILFMTFTTCITFHDVLLFSHLVQHCLFLKLFCSYHITNSYNGYIVL